VHQELDFLSTATVQKIATVRTPPSGCAHRGNEDDYIDKPKKEMAERFERARVPEVKQ
jgi:hypothetical protein